MTKIKLLFLLVTVFFTHEVGAQNAIIASPASVNRIPDLITISASATHLYALSESEGLVVFRTNTDTLQYIFTSEGMQQRGHTLVADVRFAYQFGQGNRITVIEPTSLLGVYSSTNLPNQPLSVSRVATTLYIATGSGGLLALPLDSPSAFDTKPVSVDIPGDDTAVIDVISVSNRFYALLSSGNLGEFLISGNEIVFRQLLATGVNEAKRLHQIEGQLHASDSMGNLFLLQSDGNARIKAEFDDEVSSVERWNESYVVRTSSGQIYKLDSNGTISILLSDRNNGNHFAIANNSLWIATFDILSRYTISTQTPRSNSQSRTGQLQFKPIANQLLTFPRALLVPLETSGVNPSDVRFQIESEVNNAEVRGNGFYWQPTLSQTGIHQFSINAISSNGQTLKQSFTVDVRSFNAPPRFNPSRPITISVDENFTLPIKAIDPDGVDQDLIRYHGVDLPEGSSISERTGMFSWTPDRRQVGDHVFRVIATDQFGAATSQSISITVRNISRN